MSFLKLSMVLMLAFLYASSAYNVTEDCNDIVIDDLLNANKTELTAQIDACIDPYADCPDPGVCHDSTAPTPQRIGLAFGLTTGSGLATGVGAIVPFFPCIKRFDTKYLTAALGLASGVMIYVSLADIFHVALIHFCCVSIQWHYLINTVSFFAGIVLTILIDILVHALERVDTGVGSTYGNFKAYVLTNIFKRSADEVTITNGVSNGKTVAIDLDKDEKGAEDSENPDDEHFKKVTNILEETGHKRLKRMGLLTGIALCVHNFPEGFITFIGTISDPSLGVTLAIAIALHNMPEGVCVGIPIYYTTGSRLKAFFWAFLSGFSEPLGALIAYAVFRSIFNPLFFGISFALISGMMGYVGFKELLPMAHKFDTTNGVLTNVCLVMGMVIIAISLVLGG